MSGSEQDRHWRAAGATKREGVSASAMEPPDTPRSKGGLAPGAVVTGSNGSQYLLRTRIHDGPRSQVFLANRQDGGGAVTASDGDADADADAYANAPSSLAPPPPPPLVAVKFCAARRKRASRNEEEVMHQLTRCPQATGVDGFAAPLLDAFEYSGGTKPPCLALVTPAYGRSAAAVARTLARERGRGLPRRAVRRMARTLLQALAHMHGPEHRTAYLDLKPHNLVLELPPETRGGDGAESSSGQQRRHERWRLIDFGNASPLVRRGPWPLAHLPTATAATTGGVGSLLARLIPAPFGWRAARLPEYASPAYEAPESVLRVDGHPGAPADVWALGCVLFEAATGRPLFRPLVVGDGGGGRGGDEQDEENDGDSGGDEDGEEEDDDGRAHWRRRVFSTAAEARLLSAVRATLGGPVPARSALRRSPVWRDYYDDRGEPWEDYEGINLSSAAARKPGRGGARGWRLEDRLRETVGAPSAWGTQRAAAFAAFLRPMLATEPDARATAERMLRHEWLLSSSEEGEEEEDDDDDEEGGGGGSKRRGGLVIEELV